MATLKHNRTRIITLVILTILFATAILGMETKDWTITVLRGLSVGAVVFLVASGLSLIFGLMDVLNLAHGELYMLGAYIGWTVFVRPDTFVDVVPILLFLAVGFALLPLWRVLLSRMTLSRNVARIWPWLAVIVALVMIYLSIKAYPIAVWNPEVYTESPISFSLAASQGTLAAIAPAEAGSIPAIISLTGVLLGGVLLAISSVGFGMRGKKSMVSGQIGRNTIIYAAALLLIGLLVFFANDGLTTWLFEMNSTWRFFFAIAISTLTGFVLGALIEITSIRPLYDRPMYQLMITLGLSFIIIEVVRIIWGRPEFTMPKAALFTGTGDGCPATSIGDLIANQCSTFLMFEGRVRTYNEVFVILVGLVVLIAVTLLIQRTRLGMVIRAGVQDSEMVEALGINVRRVFTLVFALGVALASLGGIIAAPSTGLSTAMGTQVLLLALIALAIGGLTSFPGAAAGAVLVGLMQQFIIKYGQIGINIPFLAEPFKPSPPLVPASVVMLMVIILLILPNGLLAEASSAMQSTIPTTQTGSTGVMGWLKSNRALVVVMALMMLFPFIVATIDGQSISGMLNSETGNAKFMQGLMIEVFILAIFALSYDLILGITGLLSFGHAMFFAVGAYLTGIALKSFEWSLPVTFLALAVAAILQALLFGLVLARVEGITFALVTLGFASVFFIVVQSTELQAYTGADVGLQGVISPDFINTSTERFRLYMISLFALFFCYLIYRRFVDSPTGRVCIAIRENEPRAKMLGYNTWYFKLVALTLSSMTAVLAGFLHTIHQPIVSPNVASLGWTVAALLIILIGGVGTLSGAIVGAAVFRLLEYYLDKWFGEIAAILLGAVYVIIVLFLPFGIVGTWQARRNDIEAGRRRLLKLFGLDRTKESPTETE